MSKNEATNDVYQVAIKSNLDHSPLLSKKLDNTILVKREDTQSVFSFKCRGAFHKINSLSEKEKQKGIIAASAGNHAQGVALAGKKLGLSTTIVMPSTTPPIKVNGVKSHGAKVILHGDAYDDACQHAKELTKTTGATFIHPFDDPKVIQGQGTVATEILDQYPDHIDAIFIPVGGGGLLAGMAQIIKAHRPEIKIIGVEPEDAPCLKAALEKGAPTTLKEVGIFVDGAAVKRIGTHTFKLIKDTVDDVITVSTDEVCAAIKDIFDNHRTIAEPAGALSLAGLKKAVETQQLKNKTLIHINSGANVNFDRLRHIAERADLGEHNEALFAVTIPEKPGSFKTFCNTIGKRAITEFNYRYHDDENATIFVGVALQDGETEKQTILQAIKDKDYPIIDLSQNEVAKLHLRHMVGGHSQAKNERLFRFQFPERPGALMNFLKHIGKNWNISLFHYRNHGADYGRVLVGIQVPKEDNKQLKEFLKELGYRHKEESENPAYPLFL